LADVLSAQGKYGESEALCREALVADRKRAPNAANDAVLADTLDSLGIVLFYRGDFAAAEGPMREALKLREQSFGLEHARTAQSMNNLGSLYFQSGRYDDAMAEYQRALPVFKKVYGPEHAEVAAILNNIGRSALMTGHVEQAEPLLRQSLAITEKTEGDHHEDLIAPLNSVAMIDAYYGRLDAARAEIQRVEAIARQPDHGELLDQVLLNGAEIDISSGKDAEAAALLAESRGLLEKNHPNTKPEAWRYARWDTVNAGLMAAQGDTSGAERALLAAQHILVERFGASGLYSVIAERQLQRIRKSPVGKPAN
jgi:tetratricopeptide (TPR) repeat protein